MHFFESFGGARAKRSAPFFFLIVCAAIAQGCVSARMSDRESDRLFRQGSYDAAAERLKEGLKNQGEASNDSLLYLLDIGLSLHAAGKYEESNRYLLRAERIADIKDYTSLSTEGATLLTSDNIKHYKGEDFEKVMVNTYLAMNFALMGEREAALVEARKVNSKLYRMVNEGKRKYQQNAFARYLSAILYEADGEYNDAYIDYKKTYELEPRLPGLGRDLWRLASYIGHREDMERWETEFALTAEDKSAARALRPKSGKAEIVVLYENGISPIKRPHPNWASIPKFYPRYNPVGGAKIKVNGEIKASTHVVHDIESTAIANLDEKYAGLIAKKVAGVVVKEVVGDQVGRQTNSPLLGLLTKVILHASDQADVRSWNLLPRDLQVARIMVDPGLYTVQALPDYSGPLPERTVQVKAGEKVFVNFRYIP